MESERLALIHGGARRATVLKAKSSYASAPFHSSAPRKAVIALARMGLTVPFRFSSKSLRQSPEAFSLMAATAAGPRPGARRPLPVAFLLDFDDFHLTPKNRDRHAAFADTLLDQAKMAVLIDGIETPHLGKDWLQQSPEVGIRDLRREFGNGQLDRGLRGGQNGFEVGRRLS